MQLRTRSNERPLDQAGNGIQELRGANFSDLFPMPTFLPTLPCKPGLLILVPAAAVAMWQSVSNELIRDLEASGPCEESNLILLGHER
jgi:hypothetical protein